MTPDMYDSKFHYNCLRNYYCSHNHMRYLDFLQNYLLCNFPSKLFHMFHYMYHHNSLDKNHNMLQYNLRSHILYTNG